MKTETRIRPGAGAGPQQTHAAQTPPTERTAGGMTGAPAGRLTRPANSPETAPSAHQTTTPEQSAAAKTPVVPRKLGPAEINTALIHFYRGEVQRANTWRNRLDTTTNWAVLTTGATLSFAFSSPTNPHFVILINSILVAFFLFMEARRYRYYEIWSSRVRVLETGYIAQILSPDTAADDAWAEHLYQDLISPRFTISEWEAVGRRLRRNYLWIFALLAASWNLKVYLHPLPAYNFEAFIDRASVGLLPGEAVLMLGIVFNLSVAVFAVATIRLKEARGEVLPQHDFATLRRMTNWARPSAAGPDGKRRAATRRAKRARERTRSTPRSGTQTGEWRRPDIHASQPPDGGIHDTEMPEHEPEATLR
ncbi:MAG TPA: DUF2270 domain-containing protein [Pyrinomonadaceae bacterium]|nr:DUF2270 domain-containing protein [Pyrinomonadaceae bacterium]